MSGLALTRRAAQSDEAVPVRESTNGRKEDNAAQIANMRAIGLKTAGFSYDRQNVSHRTNNARFSSAYGVSAKTLCAVFDDLKKTNTDIKMEDFLLAMDTLKRYLPETDMAGRWKCDKKTYRRKWKEGVAAIASLRGAKIKFDPSEFPEDQVYLLTVDGVNFRRTEPRVGRDRKPAACGVEHVEVPTAKNLGPGSHWYNHKSHSAGITYEVGLDVRSSRICWINGPRPGKHLQPSYFAFEFI